jgi:hypothetical protein
MAKKKEEIVIWKPVKKVRLNSRGKMRIGIDEFSTVNFTDEKLYDVLGMTFVKFPDGTGQLCYIMADDKGTVDLRSTTNFEIVETA